MARKRGGWGGGRGVKKKCSQVLSHEATRRKTRIPFRCGASGWLWMVNNGPQWFIHKTRAPTRTCTKL
jgi:hypothetical protein